MPIQLADLPSRLAFDLHRARTELLSFTTWTKPDFQVGRHHKIMCRWLDRLAAGVVKRLMIFAPPRHTKSELVSRRLPAFYLGKNPKEEVVLATYGADLANRMNRDVQRIIDDPKYRQVFPGIRLPVPGERTRGRWGGNKPKRTDSYFELVGRKGCLRSAGVGGGITGMGFHLGIIDDPLKNFEEAYSPVIRDKLDEWYASTFWTRQAKDAKILVTMTRWHHDDIAGRLIDRMHEDQDADQWVVIRLPAVADDNLWSEDDREIGEVLWPERFDERFMQQAKGALGSVLFTGLYQQTPLQEGGNYFKSFWFDQSFRDAGEFWDVDKRGPVGKLQCPVFMTVDPAANEKRAADYTAIGVFAQTPWNDLLVLDMIRERLPLEGIAKKMLEVSQK
ncbi:MAG TPA: terminase family protein, partial [Nitrospira sp.]